MPRTYVLGIFYEKYKIFSAAERRNNKKLKGNGRHNEEEGYSWVQSNIMSTMNDRSIQRGDSRVSTR